MTGGRSGGLIEEQHSRISIIASRMQPAGDQGRLLTPLRRDPGCRISIKPAASSAWLDRRRAVVRALARSTSVYDMLPVAEHPNIESKQ
jgi:hypothetical protein